MVVNSSTLLNHLLDKYERSKVTLSLNKVHRKIAIKTYRDSLMKGYVSDDPSFVLTREDQEKEIKLLEKKGFVFVAINSDTKLIESIVLNEENLDECYKFLSRVKRIDKENEQIEELNELRENFNKDTIAFRLIDDSINSTATQEYTL